MSDKPEGPGWWIASDDKWYPPELHPSVRKDSTTGAAAQRTDPAQPQRWQGQADKSTQVGPRFPDLFQKALQGSHLADNVTVKNGVDEDGIPNSFTSAKAGSGQRGGTPVAAASGGSTKRRWRKGH
jgi:hypothetical protein